MNAMSWFGKSAKEVERERKINAITDRAISKANDVTNAAQRLMDALDMSDSKMEVTLSRLVQAKRAR